MKRLLPALALFASLMAISATSFAQEMALRSGTVVGITATQGDSQPAKQKSETGKRVGGALGRALGYAVNRNSGHYYGYEAANAGQAIGEAVGEGGSEGGNSGTSVYLILVEFDDGGSAAIKRSSSNGLSVGSRVRVVGSGNDAQVIAQ
jgi:outer membrane lipoprotein SlyB